MTKLCQRLDTIQQLRAKTNKALFRRLACGAALAVSLECAPFVYHQTSKLMMWVRFPLPVPEKAFQPATIGLPGVAGKHIRRAHLVLIRTIDPYMVI